MYKNSLAVFLSALFLQLANCQAQNTTCPDVQTVSNFNTTAFNGQWYRYGGINHAAFGRCWAGYFDMDGGTISITGTAGIINFGFTISNTLDESNPAIMTMRLRPLNLITLVEYDLWVIDTDYTNWVLMWDCQVENSGQLHTEVWLFTRQRQPDSETIDAINNALRAFNQDLDDMEYVDQENCPDLQENNS